MQKEIVIFPYVPEEIRGRFMSKIEFTDSCWNWIGTKQLGYGVFRISKPRRNVKAHRQSYEWTHGAISPEKVIDHLCRNKGCVNPLHLELVTNGENVMRGLGPCAMNKRKTHCKRGHEFVPGSYWVVKDYGRDCKQCKTDYYLRNKEKIDARKRAWKAKRRRVVA